MFRGCDFEYAEQLSNVYNLKLYYYNRSENTFNSGGEFELKTEILPSIPEQLLYGLNYSEKPLEFDIEILNPDDAIPFDQVIEIKNWLFGQDGWKKFKTIDERQDYHLKCILIPQEDIVDGLGIRGFKCKLRNVSAFWYGEPVTIEFDHDYLNDDILRRQTTEYTVGSLDDGVRYWTPFEINIEADNSLYDVYDVLPEIIVSINPSLMEESDKIEYFELGVSNYNSVEQMIDVYSQKQIDGNKGVSPNYFEADISSAIYFSQELDGLPPHIWNISTKYLTIDRGESKLDTDSLSVGARGFRLKKGINVCYVTVPDAISKLTFKYSPLYRIGAF